MVIGPNIESPNIKQVEQLLGLRLHLKTPEKLTEQKITAFLGGPPWIRRD